VADEGQHSFVANVGDMFALEVESWPYAG